MNERYRTYSDPVISTNYQSTLGRRSSTTNNLPNQSKSMKSKVRFSNTSNVMLMYTREECIDAGLLKILWFQTEDYAYFTNEAKEELINLMKTDLSIDSKIAQTILYQPNDDLDNEINENFVC